jgi:monofunctional biosynthetic peptidoglycan transglycosylase
LSTTRNTTPRTARRKIATTKTLRRNVSTTGRTAVRRQRAARATRIVRGFILSGIAVFLLTIAMVLPWRWFAPPTSAFMLREKLTAEAAVDYRWVSWPRLSPHLAIAVVASEDQKFPVHHGFDFASIAQALEEKKRRRGASTISQQVAKNLFLWPGRNYVRKGLEAYFTVLIETLWPKRRILEIYLNVAEFGPGTFGAEAASRRFFHKPAQRLSLREASLLAAVLPNPKKMSAGRPSVYVYGRASEIRYWVHKLGGARYLGDI